jgi:hypothetical protein
MNRKTMNKEQLIAAAEFNLERRLAGTTVKEKPVSIKYHSRHEQLGNGKKRKRLRSGK